MAAVWSLIEEKRALRKVMRARREALDPAERLRCWRALGQRLAVLPELMAAGAVSGYLPTRGEIDPSGALAGVTARGAIVAYPRVVAERPRLRFHQVTDQTELTAGAF